MALFGFGAVRAVFQCVGVGQTQLAGVVAGFDGGGPGGFDREASGSVEVVDKSTHTMEVAGIECHGCGVAGGRRRVL